MRTLHFVSHTHWDREWHEPFQIFRIWLARTIDKTLDILANDPDYRYFMLDGQTIVLEDYLEIEPAREAELREHVRTGRVLVGPWYVLPDMFLVSGEAIIRNLQRGMRMANEWGGSMRVGYIPDPFGHISQMPQILQGFGIDVAMFRRGLADEPTELWWEGADGTRVFTTYLRDGYDNAAWLVRDPEGFVYGVSKLVESLAPHAVTEHMLMMHGTDHMQPWEGLPAMMRAVESRMPETRVIHSTLPQYAKAVRQALSEEDKAELCVAHGELRNPKRHHLLPGVVSTRMWIKQRNMRAETLLEQWAEPMAAVAMSLVTAAERGNHTGEGSHTEEGSHKGLPLQDWRPELALAWKYLLQNHPHDSICGCSVDQVHAEMAPRFDWVEQIGADVVQHAQAAIIPAIDTERAGIEKAIAIVVFNAAPRSWGQAVTVQVDLPRGFEAYQVVDEAGAVVSLFELGGKVEEYARVTATPEQLRWTFGAAQAGSVDGRQLRDFSWRIDGDQVYADISVSNQGAQDMAMVQRGLEQLAQLVANPQLKLFHLVMHSLRKVDVTFFARDLPGYGVKTFWLVPANSAPEKPAVVAATVVENEFLRVEANPQDGTLTVTDKATGMVFTGVNRFVDGGDRGDLYNYCAPEQDAVIPQPAQPPQITRRDDGQVRQELCIDLVLSIPASLAANRSARSSERVDIPISTVVTLYAGARRVDFQTRVENRARDHRLRVEFPTPVQTTQSLADQAFDIVARSLRVPTDTQGWVEQPVPTLPLQKFVMVEDREKGVALATRGLMEYEARDQGGATIALTLLRCIEWLSRPDLNNRNGDAGPEKQTPGAQEQGVHEFAYSLIPYSTSARQRLEGGREADRSLTRRGAQAEALAFASPPQAIATDLHVGGIPGSGSWVEISHPDFILTAIKPPALGQGMIVRGYNAGDAPIALRLRPFRLFARAARLNLNEDILAPFEWNALGQIELQVNPREIVTVRFED
ncbi:MAG: glycoside hydrolase family 38 C-terminal domain-containing protein [Anaerolineae bacterium]